MKIKTIFLSIVLISTLAFSSSKDTIEKINKNKRILQEKEKISKKTNLKIKILARQIDNESKELDNIERDIDKVDKELKSKSSTLNRYRNNLSGLTRTQEDILDEKKDVENIIIKTLIDDFSSALAIKLASKSSFEELTEHEIYNVLAVDSKEKVINLDTQYLKVSQTKNKNEREIKTLKRYINDARKKKEHLLSLKKKQSRAIKSLEKKHKVYQSQLKETIQKQNALSSLLGDLNILKKKQIKNEAAYRAKQRKIALARQKAKQKAKKRASHKNKTSQRMIDEVDIDVRQLGSSTKGVKITRYRGKKTIAPLKSYRVEKKFGKYYDPVYKIKLFNESVVLKTKRKNAKVYNILKGKIAYAKANSGMLENVVIVKHSNGIHTVFSHLDKISPTLRVGKWIPKGYVVGRINDELTFQVTKNSQHINPLELF